MSIELPKGFDWKNGDNVVGGTSWYVECWNDKHTCQLYGILFAEENGYEVDLRLFPDHDSFFIPVGDGRGNTPDEAWKAALEDAGVEWAGFIAAYMIRVGFVKLSDALLRLHAERSAL